MLVGGARRACPEGECALPAAVLQRMGLRDGDVVVVAAPARARNCAGRLLLGPPGHLVGESRAAAAEAFRQLVCCGWRRPAVGLAVGGSGGGSGAGASPACVKGRPCADCQATPFPVLDAATGRARCPSGSSGSSSSRRGHEQSAVASRVAWAVAPRRARQGTEEGRGMVTVVPRTGVAEAHDLLFIIALANDNGTDSNGKASDGGNNGSAAGSAGAISPELARALGLDRSRSERSSESSRSSSSSSRSSSSRSSSISSSSSSTGNKSAGISSRSESSAGGLAQLLAAVGALRAPCVTQGARSGFRWCGADLELVVTKVRKIELHLYLNTPPRSEKLADLKLDSQGKRPVCLSSCWMFFSKFLFVFR
jgi:hypothetical protein